MKPEIRDLQNGWYAVNRPWLQKARQQAQKAAQPWNAKPMWLYRLQVMLRLVVGIPAYSLGYGLVGGILGAVAGAVLSSQSGHSSIMSITIALGLIIGVVSGCLQAIVNACKTSRLRENDINPN